jgi:hypothetical protein
LRDRLKTFHAHPVRPHRFVPNCILVAVQASLALIDVGMARVRNLYPIDQMPVAGLVTTLTAVERLMVGRQFARRDDRLPLRQVRGQ